jgi:putative ABC transport system substrate-binding protein
VKRREFMTLIGGVAAAWPLATRAQQGERMRRIGVLMAMAAQDDPIQLALVTAFRQGLEKLGWIEGQDIRIDTRWAAGDPDRIRRYAAELVALRPDAIVANTSLGVTAMLQETRSLPIVFLQMNDPVGSGLVASLAHPGGNVTGFTPAEFSMGGKMLEALKDVAPQISQVAVLLTPEQVPAVMTLRAIEEVAPSISVKVTAAGVHNAVEIEQAIGTCAREPNSGLVVLPTVTTSYHRRLIIEFGGSPPVARGLRISPLRAGWRLGVLRRRNSRSVPSGCVICGSHPQGGEAGRLADPTTDEIRVSHQSQDGQGPRVDDHSRISAARRRGDRISTYFAAVHKSAFGTKRTCPLRRSMSAFGGKADV